MIRKKLGEILLEMGVITTQQLQDALEEQKQSTQPLGEILVKKGNLTFEDLGRALAKQVGAPYIEKVTEQMAAPDLLAKIPLRFLRQNVVMPIMHSGRKAILTANPRDLSPLDDLSLMLRGDVTTAVATEETIIDGINKFYPLEAGKEVMEELAAQSAELELGAIEEKDLLEMANEAPIIKLVNHVLYQAVKEGASDIHIEPYEKEMRVRYRIDGTMYQKLLPPKRLQGAIVSRVKIMANLNIAEKRLPQDGRILIKIADKPIDIRVSILPSNFGERVVMRLLDKSKGVVSLQNLNLSERDYKIVSATIERPNGVVLITGPTGSGKTTTLYSIIERLNKPGVNIMTVEDPVEYTMSGVSQVQVKESIGLTFAACLRSILRQDPDIVLIGEIRDGETAQIATQASLTGHLVLSTLHTNNAPAAITRLIDMGIEAFLIASTVICVIAQRLVRTLCEQCKKAYTPDADTIKQLGLTKQEAAGITFYHAGGCDQCLNTGYRGRVAIFEVMEIDDVVREKIVEHSDTSIIRRVARERGMTELVEDGLRHIKAGVTTIEEVLSVAHAEEEIVS